MNLNEISRTKIPTLNSPGSSSSVEKSQLIAKTFSRKVPDFTSHRVQSKNNEIFNSHHQISKYSIRFLEFLKDFWYLFLRIWNYFDELNETVLNSLLFLKI